MGVDTDQYRGVNRVHWVDRLPAYMGCGKGGMGVDTDDRCDRSVEVRVNMDPDTE